MKSSESIDLILAGFDRQAIASVMKAELRQKIGEQSNQYPGAVRLFNDQYEIFETGPGQTEFERRLQELSPEEQFAWARYALVENKIEYAAWRRAKLNVSRDNTNNPYNLQAVIADLKKAGKGRDYIERALSYTQKGDTGTNHPTGDLYESGDIFEEDGVDQFLKLVLADGSTLRSAVDSLLDMDKKLAPEKRMNTLGEVLSMSHVALRYKNARAHVFSHILGVCDHIYGPKTSANEPPDFSRDDMKMDFAFRAWADYDGKPNAEYWTLLAEEILTTYFSFSMHLWRMEQADRILTGKETQARNPVLADLVGAGAQPVSQITPIFRELYGLLKDLKADFGKVYEKISVHYKELNNPSLDSVQRRQKFIELEPEFDALLTTVGKMYDNRFFYGRPIESNHGLSVYKEIVREFKALRNERALEIVAPIMDESAIDLHMDGLTLFKMEPRHNDKVNRQIVDNLFRHEAFLNYLQEQGILTGQELRFIRAAHEKNGFSAFSLEQQSKIYEKIEHSIGKSGKLRSFLFKANPMGFDDDGYPLQTYGSLRRLEVMETYQLKYGPLFIVAESNDRAERLNSFLCSDFHLNLMVHTALTEELSTMARAHRDRRRSLEYGGSAYIDRQKEKKVPEQFIRASGAVMLARSDIQLSGGPLAGLLVYLTGIKITAETLDIGVPSYLKEGQGLSNERGGGDPMVLLRLIAQTCQEWKEATGENIPDRIKAMAVSVIATVQGRALYKSEEEIYQEMEEQTAEMLGIWAELDGVLPKGSFIPQRAVFRPAMEEVLSYGVRTIMERHERFRSAKSSASRDTVLDLLARIISDPEMAGYCNNAARKNSKVGAKTMTGQRAIGSNIWVALMRTHHDGYFKVNDFFELLHTALHHGIEITTSDGEQRTIRIYKKDIETLLKSDYYNYNLFVRSLTPLARADFQHGLERLGMEGMKHEQIMALGKSAVVSKSGQFKFKTAVGSATEAQAWFASVYHSAHELRSIVEALQDGSFVKESDFSRLVRDHPPHGDNLRIKFNAAAQQRWPFLPDVQTVALRSRPALAAMDFFEKQRQAGTPADEKLLRQVAAAWRASTITPNGHIVIEHTYAYGCRLKTQESELGLE